MAEQTDRQIGTMTVELEFVPRHLSGDDWSNWCEAQGFVPKTPGDAWMPQLGRDLGSEAEVLVYFRGSLLRAIGFSDPGADLDDIVLGQAERRMAELPASVVREYLSDHDWRFRGRGSVACAYETPYGSRPRYGMVPHDEGYDHYGSYIEGAVRGIADHEGRSVLAAYLELLAASEREFNSDDYYLDTQE